MSQKIGAGHLDAWLNNGLQELQSAVALGGEQVQPGNNPGLIGTVLPQEAMLARQETETAAPAMEAAQAQETETPAPAVEAAEMQKQEPELEM